MGLTFERRKKRRIWLSVAYRLHRLLFLPRRLKLRLYLHAQWLFTRLAHEESFAVFPGREHPLAKARWAFLAPRLGADASVLDVGCGHGDLSARLAGAVERVVALDHDPRALEAARATHRHENLRFVHADARSFLDESEERYDVAILSHVLEHLDDPAGFLERLGSRCRQVFVEVPDFDASPLNVLRERLRLELAYTDADHVTEFGRDELRDLVSRARLDVVDAECSVGMHRLWCSTP